MSPGINPHKKKELNTKYKQFILLQHQDDIIYPPITKKVSYEGELGVVIGEQARNVTAADAMKYVFGYTCVNDVTARDLQKSDPMWTRGKGFDTFCPVGPWIVP